jgi:hypothetical protein
MGYDANTKTKTILEIVECPFTNSHVSTDICNQNCQFFGGYDLDKVTKTNEDGTKQEFVKGKSVLCCFPKKLKFTPLEKLDTENEVVD